MTATAATIATATTVALPAPTILDDDFYTAKELAAIFGTSARAIRRAFRKDGMGCGRGNIYAVPASDVRDIIEAGTYTVRSA